MDAFLSSYPVRADQTEKHLTYPAAQVDGEDRLFPLLQKEDDHECEGV